MQTCVENAVAILYLLPPRRKSNEDAVKERNRVSGLLNMMEPSLLQFYISRQWLNKFKTFAEPGPISNEDFLCPHGGTMTHRWIYFCVRCLCPLV